MRVHLIAVPAAEDSLRTAIGEAHRRYTRRVNFREGWRGHLWQGRFGSCVLNDQQTTDQGPTPSRISTDSPEELKRG